MTSKPFHILAKPTGAICNLDCDYCFYLEKEELYPKNNQFKMNDETLDNYIKQYIESQPYGTQEVNFGWQGGEPTLMGVNFFRKAIKIQEKYKRPSMEISNALQTNATLINDEWGKFLSDNNFLIGLSIDGPQEMHDKYRLSKNREPTFHKVLEGLEHLKNNNVEFNTLTVIQENNGDYPIEVYDFLTDIGSTYLQFIPIVVFDEERKGVLEFSTGKEQFGNFLNGVFDRWLEKEDYGKISVQHFDMLLGILLGQPTSLCVHSQTCGNCLAIEHNGDLYSCDHFVDEEHLIGNVNNSSFTEVIDGEFQKKFGMDKLTTLPKDCQECEYLKFCYGGCPKDRYIDTETKLWGDNYLCASYKTLYKHTLPTLDKIAYCYKNGRPLSDYKVLGKEQEAPKRNSPCPCGSGKKFKQCCGKK
ncbi:MAG: anaerobic sulfatase maturase [Planctomycetota bacterium]|nr:MAG: anaerobic sulfatase maturase [Planctomycetota bacterium]